MRQRREGRESEQARVGLVHVRARIQGGHFGTRRRHVVVRLGEGVVLHAALDMVEELINDHYTCIFMVRPPFCPLSPGDNPRLSRSSRGRLRLPHNGHLGPLPIRLGAGTSAWGCAEAELF